MTTEEAIAKAKEHEGKPSMVGDSLQKLDWHIQGLRLDLEGALALREAFPTLSPAAQRKIVNMLQRGLR